CGHALLWPNGLRLTPKCGVRLADHVGRQTPLATSAVDVGPPHPAPHRRALEPTQYASHQAWEREKKSGYSTLSRLSHKAIFPHVTGLPIALCGDMSRDRRRRPARCVPTAPDNQIGRASCRERVEMREEAEAVK